MLSKVVAGTPGKKFVVFHGVGDSAAGYSQMIEEFGDRYELHIYDHLGHGNSPLMNDDELQDPFGTMKAALTKELQSFGEPVILYGHSMGGALASEITIEHPELVSKLILEDPAWWDLTEQEQIDSGAARAEQHRVDFAETERSLTQRSREGWDAVETAGWLQALGQAQPELLHTGVVTSPRPWRTIVTDLHATGVPTLVLTGNMLGTVIIGRRTSDEINGMPGEHMRAEIIPGATHCVRRTKPEGTYAAIVEFL